MSCSTIQKRMTSVLAGAARRDERLEVEAHTARCARCATAYADLIATSVALERAYVPLRATTTSLSAARVHLALRRPVAVPVAVRAGRLSARFTEVALAAAVTAFAFVGSASVAPKATIVDDNTIDPGPAPAASVADSATVLKWFRIGRYAASPDLVEPPVELPSRDADRTPPGPHDRIGLQR
ncbi:MAG TPA: zf-HC2 domain-containing protein [Candidatus Limnocylindria bacterium]